MHMCPVDFIAGNCDWKTKVSVRTHVNECVHIHPQDVLKESVNRVLLLANASWQKLHPCFAWLQQCDDIVRICARNYGMLIIHGCKGGRHEKL